MMRETIYIDGVKHNCTALMESYRVNRFFVDSDEMPFRACAQHTLRGEAIAHLRTGGAVRTGGHVYSLSPPAFMHPPVVKRPTTSKWRQHFKRYDITYMSLAAWLLAVFLASLIGTN